VWIYVRHSYLTFLKVTGFFEIRISLVIFLLVVITAILISVIFGYAPARKAANINPIEAIRTL